MKIILWVLAVLLMSCGSGSKITSSWKAENTIAKQYQKILVLGIVHDKDRRIQQKMEEHFVGDLKDAGSQAISAFSIYGPNAFDAMDENQAIQKIKNTGVEAVITIVLLDKRRERNYVPGSIVYSPYGYYYDHFWGYLGALNRRIYEPGYYITDTKYFWETNLYDMASQSLVYSAQSQSFSPDSIEKLGHEFGKTIVKNMIEQQVLLSTIVKTVE